MSRTGQKPDRPDSDEARRAELLVLVDALTSPTAGEEGHDALIESARELLRRKLAMTGTKQETQRHVEKLIAAEIERLFSEHASGAGSGPEAAQVVLGALASGTLLAEFAAAVDRAILECSAPRDFSFAGRADFISLEEVLQLLGGAKHRGCLSLEKPDNRLDVYLDNSTVAFLDPHRFVRRVLPAADRISYREIGADLLREAERRHGSDAVPIAVTLGQHGFFRDSELRDATRVLGLEVLFEFLRQQVDCAYSYRRLDELPPFAVRYNLKLPVTPILLEGNKRLDDWRSMIKVFPDPDQPLCPVDDMYAQISSLDLNVIEIKLLAQIDGQTTPRKLAPALGLPLQEVYKYLVRFAKAGVIEPPGDRQTLDEVAMSVEESVEVAIQALDANDDGDDAVSSALDKVLGGD